MQAAFAAFAAFAAAGPLAWRSSSLTYPGHRRRRLFGCLQRYPKVILSITADREKNGYAIRACACSIPRNLRRQISLKYSAKTEWKCIQNILLLEYKWLKKLKKKIWALEAWQSRKFHHFLIFFCSNCLKVLGRSKWEFWVLKLIEPFWALAVSEEVFSRNYYRISRSRIINDCRK